MTRAAKDAELLARIAEGDHEAFTEVMRTHEDRVFSVCLRIMGNRELALDATQEAFLTAFRKASQFKGESTFGTWVYRIATNACYDILRKRKRRPTEPLLEHAHPADPSAEASIDSAALRPEIERALASIPPEFRAAVVLSDIEGLGLSEVAKVLGVPVGTVKSRVFRARRLLAQQLGNQ